MPTLPTKKDLGRVFPQPSPSIRAPDMTSQYRGLQQLGGTIAAWGQEREQKDDALELIKAEAELRKGLYEIQRDFQNDSDYPTYDQRFQERRKALLDRTSSMVSGERARELWATKAGMEAEVVRDKILRRGQHLHREGQLADLDASLDTHLNIIANPRSSQDERDQADTAITHAIDLAKRTGVLDPVKSRKLREKYGQEAERITTLNKLSSGEDVEKILNELGVAHTQKKRAIISPILETGEADPRKGIARVYSDTEGTWSFGNFGLNTGGSMQRFIKDYASDLGFTAEPGTAEFRTQWNRIATENPDKLIAAERAWYSDTIASKVPDRLISAGVPGEIANDTRVQTYFADRSVQQGGGSIKNHSRRIAEAVGMSTDADSFIKAMTHLDVSSVERDFVTRLAEVEAKHGKEVRDRFAQGLRNRSLRRADMSMGSDDVEDGYAGPYKYMTPRQRLGLANTVKAAHHSKVVQDLRDDAEYIKDHGVAPKDSQGRTAIDRAKLFLSPSQMRAAEFKIQSAHTEYKAISPLKEMPESVARDHIDGLLPSHALEGEHYAIAARIHDKAMREWDRVLRKRDSDPADAVETSKEVVEAIKRINALGGGVPNSVKYEHIIDARLKAQERLGIPVTLRKIITKREAYNLLQLPRNPTEEDVEAAFRDASKRAVERYGKYAIDALRMAKDFRISSQSARESADLIIDELSEKPVAKKETSTIDSVLGFFGFGEPEVEEPAPKTPNENQINMLMSDPSKYRNAFDTEFGAGTSARIILERGAKEE